jgi:hypothetical protein
VKVDAAKEKKDLGMFYLRNASINPSDVSPRTCLKRFALTSLAREKCVIMLLVTLPTPGRLLSSNMRQSSQLPVISSKKTWAGLTSIIS